MALLPLDLFGRFNLLDFQSFDDILHVLFLFFVVGLPLELDGTEERSARLARQIGEALDAATECAVHYMDERFSSVEAEQKLIEMNVSRKRRKEVVDQVAAIVILERYLNSMQRGSGER